ncbi:MAG: flagellar hook-length control protein FliK [Firmicutes bacterium]|nr:flagellar hook-length control protein FliK [Bacillota bacterium]
MLTKAQIRENTALNLPVPQRKSSQIGQTAQATQPGQKRRDFDKLMASRENQSTENQPRERDTTRQNRRAEQLTTNSTDRPTQPTETAPPTDIPTTDTETPVETPIAETPATEEEIQLAIVYVIAELLQIPPDQVIEIATELQIMPEELAEPAVASKFLQTLLEVENPVELLVMPEYPEELQKVVDTTQAAIVTLETEPPAEVISRAATNLDRLNLLGNLTTEVDENNQLIVTERPQATETAEPTTVIPQRLDAPLFPIVDEPQTEQRTTTELRIIRSETTDNAAEYRPLDEIIPQATNERPIEVAEEIQPREVVVQVTPASVLANQAAAIANIAEAQQATSPTQIMQQIVTQIKTIVPETFVELRMTLRPEHLGDVTLRVAVQNGIVTAMFVAESQRIKEIIESNFNQLRDALEEQGISIAELFVSVNTGDDNDQTEQMSQYLKAQQEAMHRLQRAAGISAIEEEEPEPERILMDSTVEFTA